MKKSALLLFVLSIFILGMKESGPKTHNPFLQVTEYPKETVMPEAEVIFGIELPEHHEFAANETLSYEFISQNISLVQLIKQGELSKPAEELPIKFKLLKTGTNLEINAQVPYCSTTPPKMCKWKSLEITQPLVIAKEGKKTLEIKAEIKD